MREKIFVINNNILLKILDLFVGGGLIFFEVFRFGCEVYVGDFNLVVVLIEKVILEFL